jgi:hypothetical protein
MAESIPVADAVAFTVAVKSMGAVSSSEHATVALSVEHVGAALDTRSNVFGFGLAATPYAAAINKEPASALVFRVFFITKSFDSRSRNDCMKALYEDDRLIKTKLRPAWHLSDERAMMCDEY